MLNLRTLLGRIFAETGLVGVVLFASIIPMAGRELRRAYLRQTDEVGKALLMSARLALVALLLGHTIGHGSLALPYLWFWLAVIDSRWILCCTKERG